MNPNAAVGMHIVPENRIGAPTRLPLRRAADILSRVRSAIIRSNGAKLSRMFSVRHPGEAVVLNCCVTETKVAPCLSKTSITFAKSSGERVSRSTL